MQKNDDIPRGQLSTIILKTLLDNDKYGYEIINDVAEQTNGKIAIKQPSLYSCLRRMEDQSLISSYWRDSSLGGRRHYYRITDYGKKYVEKWQADFLSPAQDEDNKKSKVEDSTDTDKPVFLEQGNLFQETSKSENQNSEVINEKVDNSFIQYDLFTQSTFIAKPSVDVFETVKDKQTENCDFQQQESPSENQEDRISKLRNTILETNENNIEIEPVNIKKEFLLLKKKQKSYTESYKDKIDNDDGKILDEDIELKLKEPVVSFDDANIDEIPSKYEETPLQPFIKETIDDSFVPLTEENNTNNVEEKQTYTDYEQSLEPVFVDLDEEVPTIFKSTTEFNEINETFITETKPLENENLAQSDIDVFEDTLKVVQENFNEDNISTPIENVQQIQDDSATSHLSRKDDGVFITEKPDPQNAPKVKKIAPNRFEHFNSYNQSENTIDILYKNKFDQNIENPEEQQQINETSQDETAVPSDNIINYTNFEQLASYYKQNGINFSSYKKLPKSAKSKNSTYVKANKFNMLTSAVMFGLIFIQTLIIGIICSPKQPNLWFMYVFPPIASAIVVTYYSITFFKNKTRLVAKASLKDYNFVLNSIISLIAILMIFSINLICGMSYGNLLQYSTSFIYLAILTLNLPILSLVKYILLQIKLADA